MANSKALNKTTSQNDSNLEVETEVLYQKLGDRWFAFSIINDEVFMSPVTEDKVIAVKQEGSPSTRLTSYEL